MAIGRSLHARPYESGHQLHQRCGDRRSHAGRRRRRSGGFQSSGVEDRRYRGIDERGLAGMVLVDARHGGPRGREQDRSKARSNRKLALKPDIGERFMGQMIVSRASAHGFLVFDWWHRRNEALRRLAAWHREGKIRFKEDVLEGIERMADSFLRLLSGKNFGKQIVKIS